MLDPVDLIKFFIICIAAINVKREYSLKFLDWKITLKSEISLLKIENWAILFPA